MMANCLNSILGSFGGIAQTFSVAIQFAAMEWQRNSEYTADRAGIIAAGDVDYANTQTMKLLGKSDNISDIDFSLDNVMQQYEDFQLDSNGLIGKILYINYTAAASHPWTVLRLKQINDWYNSGELENLVQKYGNQRM